jgi:hypothetical protein
VTVVDTLVSVVACREALTAALRATEGDRASAAAGLIGALVVLASTAPGPTDMLDGLLGSLEAARPALMHVRARIEAAGRESTQPGGPS